MLANLIDNRIFTIGVGLTYIKVKAVVELGFELTTLQSEVLCSTADLTDHKLNKYLTFC